MQIPGPFWPFYLRAGVALVIVVLLMRVGWIAGRRTRSGMQAAAAIAALVTITAASWLLIPHTCTLGWRLGIELPGCDWEYSPPPDGAGALTMWILAGAVFQVVTLGLPFITAAVAAGAARAVSMRRREAAIAVRP
jgi:hypothetical protein